MIHLLSDLYILYDLNASCFISVWDWVLSCSVVLSPAQYDKTTWKIPNVVLLGNASEQQFTPQWHREEFVIKKSPITLWNLKDESSSEINYTSFIIF
jgi:hypothetical protein